eukprot:357079-Chlamydomonas_euryale.AAC.8
MCKRPGQATLVVGGSGCEWRRPEMGKALCYWQQDTAPQKRRMRRRKGDCVPGKKTAPQERRLHPRKGDCAPGRGRVVYFQRQYRSPPHTHTYPSRTPQSNPHPQSPHPQSPHPQSPHPQSPRPQPPPPPTPLLSLPAVPCTDSALNVASQPLAHSSVVEHSCPLPPRTALAPARRAPNPL